MSKRSDRSCSSSSSSEKNLELSSPKMIPNGKDASKKLPDVEKRLEEEKVWKDLMGDEIPWKDMSTKAKVRRVILNTSKIMAALTCLYFFVCSLGLLSSAFSLIAGKSTGSVMNNEYISNPIVGLMIGILVTVLVQSSSTSTSIIVSMVAAGILTVSDAIPMIMGSNIGTSLTNTIVSLTQVGDREVFRKAFSGATVHDMFNWLAVLVLLPIEIISGMLESLTFAIVNSLTSGGGAEVELLTVITDPFTNLIVQLDSQVMTCWGASALLWKDSMVKEFCDYNPSAEDNSTTEAPMLISSTSIPNQIPMECRNSSLKEGIPHSCHFLFYETSLTDSTIGIILLIMSLIILCTSLILIVKILNTLLKGSIAKVIKKVVNADIPYVPWLTGYIAIAIGAVLTFIVQSSSVFTSTMTPLIGLGIISVQRAYPLTLGSNIGTTTTALLAAMATATNRKDSMQIALVHFFFNVIAICIYYPIPFMRWPIPLCLRLGNITAKYRWFAIVYLVSMFFLLPGSVFALSLGGPAVLWGVLGPILLLLVFIVAVNLLQTRKPQFLPSLLRNWDFLPLPLHSFKPYDKYLTSLPCCKSCKMEVILGEDDVIEVITAEVVEDKIDDGHHNPNFVLDT